MMMMMMDRNPMMEIQPPAVPNANDEISKKAH